MRDAASPLVWLVVLPAGLVALAAGVGLGPRHYAVEGLGPPAVAGAVLMGAGLGASAWATIRVLSATRRRWWAPVLALVLVTAALVLWTLGQAVAASYAPRPALGERTPADLGLGYRDVTFPSSDGTDLAGWYVPTRNGAAVVLMHGAGSTRSEVLEHAAVLAEHGLGVLLFDARPRRERGPCHGLGSPGGCRVLRSRPRCDDPSRPPPRDPIPPASCSSRPGRCRTRGTPPTTSPARATTWSGRGPSPARGTPEGSRKRPPRGRSG